MHFMASPVSIYHGRGTSLTSIGQMDAGCTETSGKVSVVNLVHAVHKWYQTNGEGRRDLREGHWQTSRTPKQRPPGSAEVLSRHWHPLSGISVPHRKAEKAAKPGSLSF